MLPEKVIIFGKEVEILSIEDMEITFINLYNCLGSLMLDIGEDFEIISSYNQIPKEFIDKVLESFLINT